MIFQEEKSMLSNYSYKQQLVQLGIQYKSLQILSKK